MNHLIKKKNHLFNHQSWLNLTQESTISHKMITIRNLFGNYNHNYDYEFRQKILEAQSANFIRNVQFLRYEKCIFEEGYFFFLRYSVRYLFFFSYTYVTFLFSQLYIPFFPQNSNFVSFYLWTSVLLQPMNDLYISRLISSRNV